MKKENVLNGDLIVEKGKVYQYEEVTGNVSAPYVIDFPKMFPNLVKVGGSLDLSALTAIPKGFNPTVGGPLDLSALTAIPKGFNPTVGGYLDLSALTAIPKGLYGNNKTAANKCYSMLMSAFAADGFFFADGILARIVSQRGPVARVVIFGETTVSYVVTDGEGNYSHGDTLDEARADLMVKRTSKDLTQFKSWTLDKEVSKYDAIMAYRSITGACKKGTRHWLEQRQTPETITVAGIIELTTGAYGSEKFKKFFDTKPEAK